MEFRMVDCDLDNDSSSVFLQKMENTEKVSTLTPNEKLALKTLKQGTKKKLKRKLFKERGKPL